MIRKSKPILFVSALVIGFVLAVGLRILVGNRNGSTVAQSSLAGGVFALCLAGLICLRIPKTVITKRSIIIGLIGGIILCVPSILAVIFGHTTHRPYGSYWQWSIIVSLVALAEEAFLRGTLFATLMEWKGEKAALLISALLFALLHVPLYGWHVVPLDFAVGLWLGSLRLISGTYVAPAVTHIGADLAGWWLR